MCGSFSDQALHSRGALEAFRRVGSKQKWLYTHRDGKWCHYYDPQASETRTRFFDYFLKGIDTGWQEELPVRLAVYDVGSRPVAVVGVKAWPPNQLQWSTLSLDAASQTLVDVCRSKWHRKGRFPLNTSEVPKGPASFIPAVPATADCSSAIALLSGRKELHGSPHGQVRLMRIRLAY